MNIETTPTPNIESGFTTLGLPAVLVDGLARRGITTPTDVQNVATPGVLKGQDMIVQAKTGTGKTFAFGLPILTALAGPEGQLPRALVVAPTRELALQVADDLITMGSLLGLRTTTVYGGQDFEPQLRALGAGVDIVVGTPGRLLDLASRGHLDLSNVQHLVLDEADEMLAMGFLPDVRKIFALAGNRRQTLLFSATMPSEIRTLSRSFLANPTYVSVVSEGDSRSTVAGVTQHFFQAHPLDKPEILARILQADGRSATIVFCRTKMTAQRLADDMIARGFSAASLHGDLPQVAREKALAAFRSGTIDVLIATDVAARGIDVDGISHVINYQTPEDAATYLHRIGRTARAGRTGTAVTFIEWDAVARWKFISEEIGLENATPVETYSTSEHLFSLLSIPTTVKGSLPGAPGAKPSHPEPSARGTRPRTSSSRRPNRSEGRSGSTSGEVRRSSTADVPAPRRGEVPTTDGNVAPRVRRRTRSGSHTA